MYLNHEKVRPNSCWNILCVENHDRVALFALQTEPTLVDLRNAVAMAMGNIACANLSRLTAETLRANKR